MSFVPLCPDFLSVFEGEPHIVLAVDGHIIHQSAPKGGLKLVNQFSLCQSFKEVFNRCPAGLLAADGLVQGFVPRLASIEPCGQSIIAFLVFDLVEGNMSIFVDAKETVISEITEKIHEHISLLKQRGMYDDLVGQVLQFKLSAQIFDVFGRSIDDYAIHDLFSTTDTDIERQFRLAETRLGNEGVGNAYVNRYYDEDDVLNLKIQVIIFAANTDCMDALNEYAEQKFHDLNDANRRRTVSLPEKFKKKYDDIVSDGDIISKHNFRLPETIRVPHEMEGRLYSNHLFVDDGSHELMKRKVITPKIWIGVGYTYSATIPTSKGSTRLISATAVNSLLQEAALPLYDKLADRHTPIRRLAIAFEDVVDEGCEGYDLFTDWASVEREKARERAVMEIAEKYGKNALLRGTSYLDASTQRERNEMIGGHRAGYDDAGRTR